MNKALYLLLFPIFVCSVEMTLEEKVGQCLMVQFHGEEVTEEARVLIQELHAGAIIYYNWANGLHSPDQVLRLSTGLQALARIPLLIAIDQEGGRVVRLKEGFPVLPSNQAMAQTEDPSLVEYGAYLTGLALRAVGVNMNLAPVVDVNSNPRNPVINSRAFGNSPEIAISFGSAALQGYHRAGVIASLKHFPGHGDVEVDSHFALPCVNKSLDQLEQAELLPFKMLAPHADSVMTAHIQVPALDPEGGCATVSKHTLNYLRDRLNFKGVIISDSLVMKSVLKTCASVEEATIRALDAGCDMLILGGRQLVNGNTAIELSTNDVRSIHQALVTAIRSGRISEERLNQAVERILQLKSRYALQAKTRQVPSFVPPLRVSPEEAQQVAHKIWLNECHGSLEGLTHWNAGEEFGSFGIGHFIWYPEGKQGPFRETFPALLAFLQSHGTQLPTWLKRAQTCPWSTQAEFSQAQQNSDMQTLRQLLYQTKDLQALFIAQRLEQTLPTMLAKTALNQQPLLSNLFYNLASSRDGLYALIDYVNFKGEGTSPKEAYQGYGWGLFQVLQHMPSDTKQPLKDFVKAAKIVLVRRVENSPPTRNEQAWLKGWFNRLDTYDSGQH